MSFYSYLENLRAKPEHVRRRYSFWTSFGITAIIFVFWLGSFSISNLSAQAPIASAVEKAGSPGQSMIAGVASFFGDLKELIFGAKRVTYTSIEVLPGDTTLTQ